MTSDETRPDRDALREQGLRESQDEYPPMPSGATVETLWKSLNDLHCYAMEAIAAEKEVAARHLEFATYANESAERMMRQRDEARRVLAAVEVLRDEWAVALNQPGLGLDREIVVAELTAALAGDQP